jgi:hypothetical protein
MDPTQEFLEREQAILGVDAALFGNPLASNFDSHTNLPLFGNTQNSQDTSSPKQMLLEQTIFTSIDQENKSLPSEPENVMYLGKQESSQSLAEPEITSPQILYFYHKLERGKSSLKPILRKEIKTLH